MATTKTSGKSTGYPGRNARSGDEPLQTSTDAAFDAALDAPSDGQSDGQSDGRWHAASDISGAQSGLTLNAQPTATLDEHLRSNGLTPTRQRLQIAGELLHAPVHLSADEVHDRVRAAGANVSRATVYNTLSLLVERGLIRQVVVDSGKVFYDSNTTPHHHFFDTDSGELIDIPVNDVTVSGLPDLPSDKQLDGIDVIVRVSSRQ